ncbi:hypothetical protein B0T45_11650 [Chromobacterium haemolyticum]|uniref:GpE family phage tail protein n=1 Tax=Chromobacterium haemolyticum TaxID=394935 RepID=A0A1W0CYV9_9NEIS|nr:hypothetical protein B0T45_11650 [Chromobacterium haemolyticum]
MAFAPWWAAETELRRLDGYLLTVLRMQPSEIDGLEMEDYWGWIEETEREVKRRNETMQSLYGR